MLRGEAGDMTTHDVITVRVRHVGQPVMDAPPRFVFPADQRDEMLARLRAAGLEPIEGEG